MHTSDRTLLTHMQKDASLSVAELAAIAGMSKSACWRRIQKLEEQGVIRSRVTLLNPIALDLSLTVFIAVKTNQHNKAWAERFREVTQNIPGVLEVYRMGGEVDYLIKAVVQGMPGYDALYQELGGT
jgi:Lrp/AsnC family transcriptional regulator